LYHLFMVVLFLYISIALTAKVKTQVFNGGINETN